MHAHDYVLGALIVFLGLVSFLIGGPREEEPGE